MNGNITLQHLISHSLQIKYFNDINDFQWRKALKKLRQHHTLNDFFTYIPQALTTLNYTPHVQLQEDWQQMMKKWLSPNDMLHFDAIQKTISQDLKTQFFTKLCYYTLAWQYHHLNNKIKQNSDKDIQRYFIMPYLLYLEELLSINENQNKKQELTQQIYTLCFATQWLLLFYKHKSLVIPKSLNYQAEEMEFYLSKAYNHSALEQMAQHLAEQANKQKKEALMEEESLSKNKAYEELQNFIAEKRKAHEQHLITSEEAAKLLGKSVATISRYRNDNRISYEKINNTYYHYREEIELLAKH